MESTIIVLPIIAFKIRETSIMLGSLLGDLGLAVGDRNCWVET